MRHTSLKMFKCDSQENLGGKLDSIYKSQIPKIHKMPFTTTPPPKSYSKSQTLSKKKNPSQTLPLYLFGSEEQLAVFASVLLRVLEADVRQALAHGARGLVGGQDALPWGHDGVGDAPELGLELRGGVAEVGGHGASVGGGGGGS